MPVPKEFSRPTWQPPRIGLTWLWRGIGGLLLIWVIFSGFSTVPADSVGVLTRFGAYQGVVMPGLRFKFPLGIDKLEIVPVQRQLKLEFGFQAEGSSSNPDQRSEEPEEEQTMVTGDLNMANVEWVVQYRIEDPKQFLFNVRDPGSTLRDAGESVMREVVGDRTVDEVLTIGRQEAETFALQGMKEFSQRYGLGIGIMQVQLKNVQPPSMVQSSFNEVNQAQQEREQMINVANGEYNKAVPRARGEASQKITSAEGYALRRVNEARGDGEKFNAQLAEYLKAPEITRQRLYYETIAEVLPQLERKVILDEKAGQLLPLLPLDSREKAR
jgi:membrane protease subunit HflK